MITLRDLHRVLGGTLRAPRNIDPDEIPLGPIAVDSRHVEPGGIYWAVPGRYHDGAEYADEAFRRGAAGAVVHRLIEKPAKCWALEVTDPTSALYTWAAFCRRHFRGTVIGVAGSVGRRTTRRLLHAALSQQLHGKAEPIDETRPLSLPLSVLRTDPSLNYAIYEIYPRRLSEPLSPVALCQPTVAIVAQVAEGPGAGLRGRKELADLAEELLAALPSSGLAVLGDDPWLRPLASRCQAPILWVGPARDCQLAASDVQWGPGTVSFRLENCRYHVALWQREQLVPALAAIGVARALGLSPQAIAEGLACFDAVPSHWSLMQVRGSTVLHDPRPTDAASRQAALERFRELEASGRRILVWGELAATEPHSPPAYRQLGQLAVTVGRPDLLVTWGPFSADVIAGACAAGLPAAHAVACRSAEEALPRVCQALVPGDLVLVCSAKDLSMEKLADALHRFPRRRAA